MVRTSDGGVEHATRRGPFATHLMAIDHFEADAQDIEKENASEDWHSLSSESCSRYVTYSTSVVIRSVAFLEATINEMLRRVRAKGSPGGTGYDTHPSLESDVGVSLAEDLIKDRESTFCKYDTVLDECGESEINRGHGAGQQAKMVVDLRNHLVHADPEMHPPDELPDQLTSLPRTVKWSNPFETGTEASLERCIGTTMIEWAAESCFDYAEEFFDRLDIENDISPAAVPLSNLYIDENPARPYVPVLESLDHDYR